ncbi:PLP-dependent aminotransferase family protein [Aquabacterium lacunae]|uniref:PLP-dependent aminotransferase family protein n=2 Tax=Aquabacterium lacunae TaxID=2528630 RepID=A0A4V6MTR0_9BURK|nr:PLP-dependent aminotransferase family protein [Aquabacterium lacunae]
MRRTTQATHHGATMSELNDLLEPTTFRAQAMGQGQTLQRALYERLKQAIGQGRLLPGARLPGSRELALELGMSRNGVIHAYELLTAEGHVQPTRQGTVVAPVGRPPSPPVTNPRSLPWHRMSQRSEGFDRRRTVADDLQPFMPGIPALDAFPQAVWGRSMARARQMAGADSLSYRPAAGEPELRQAIATYMRAARGLQCHADQVFVTDGTQQALELVARLLADPGDLAWIEHPGYGGARSAFVSAGLKLQPITVGPEGIDPPEAWWSERTPRLVYTTPSHQYPLGCTLSLSRRLHLIARAHAHGSWLVEDDYDSEFRHDGPPLAAMQGLEPHAPVVYVGTFSKTVFPALRLGFFVVPEAVVDRVAGVVGAWCPRGHALSQWALADFIDEGHFTRHLRRMRRLYRARQAALREALARHWPLPGQVLGGQAGMHLVLSLPATHDDRALAWLAHQAGQSPRPLSLYGTGGIDGFNGLVMGYANTPEGRMNHLVKQLAELTKA